MIRGFTVLISLIFLFSCSNDVSNKNKIEKEYYDDGQLKTLVYHFKTDDIKKIGFSSNGTLEYIHDISNNGKDNFMMIFDGDGKLWMIEPNKNNQRTGTSMKFDEGNIVLEEEYSKDVLIK